MSVKAAADPSGRCVIRNPTTRYRMPASTLTQKPRERCAEKALTTDTTPPVRNRMPRTTTVASVAMNTELMATQAHGDENDAEDQHQEPEVRRPSRSALSTSGRPCLAASDMVFLSRRPYS